MPLPLKIHLTVFAVSVVAGIVLSYTKDAQTLADLARRVLVSMISLLLTAAVGADLLALLHDGLISIGFDASNPATWTDTGIITLAIVLTVWPFFVIHWLQSMVGSICPKPAAIDLDRLRSLKSSEGTAP